MTNLTILIILDKNGEHINIIAKMVQNLTSAYLGYILGSGYERTNKDK